MNSEWVKTEIARARKREVSEKRRMLFPLGLVDFEILRDWECFDADTGKDSAREIRVLHPRFQQLEGARHVQNSIRSTAPGFERSGSRRGCIKRRRNINYSYMIGYLS